MIGDELPDLRTAIPGPRSRELGRRLGRVESPTITRIHDGGPVFWAEAVGSNVRDVDGNRYVDLTAGFGVAAAGHGNAAVAAALSRQGGRLVHAMGDVHPAEVKVELLERLAELAPGAVSVGMLSANGGDAVEAALKTAALATGRPGVVAFHGAYHGLGYGALGVTGIDRFREPFARQLYPGVRFAPFPAGSTEAAGTAARGGPTAGGGERRATLAESVDVVRRRIVEARGSDHAVGAVIVEPIQGRAGIIVPPDGFLSALRDLCTELGVLLILDEVYTGLGRTGRWFACQHDEVVPDLLVIGKALAGGLPLSAALGTPDVMDAWPASSGEALHTSTFLGNPVTCAAALAQLREIEEHGLVQRAAQLGDRVAARLDSWVRDRGWAASHRGRGLMRALSLAGPDPTGLAGRATEAALRRGVLILPEGDALAITPPLVITERQLDHALDVVEEAVEGSFTDGG